MILISHPTSNINASATARGLYRHGLLSRYYTCVSWDSDSLLAKSMPRTLSRWLNRRKRIEIPVEKIKTRPFRELMRHLCGHAGLHGLHMKENAWFSMEQIYYDLDRYVAADLPKYPGLRGVYAYDDGALMQFQRAHEMGLSRIYDLPIGHWRALKALSAEESEAQPEWRNTIKALTDSAEKNQRKDAEIELANLVVVASSFTKRTLELFPKKKIVVVVPYGMPAVTTSPRNETKSDSPLRVLFVGSLTQRKGISYLFEALAMMGKSATLTLIGTKGGQAKVLDDACSRHHWIETLPHSEILEEMHRHDVFVFPSLFEGFGLVIGEALSQGLPVITTPHTGGPEVMQDGVEGFIVPIRSAEAIAAKLQILHRDRALLKHMSDAARIRAMESSWDRYEDGVASAVTSLLDSKPEPSSSEHIDAIAGSRTLGQEFIHGGVKAGR